MINLHHLLCWGHPPVGPPWCASLQLLLVQQHKVQQRVQGASLAKAVPSAQASVKVHWTRVVPKLMTHALGALVPRIDEPVAPSMMIAEQRQQQNRHPPMLGAKS